MERILLVEPNYTNKYPPIGLMKISTYFKAKGDFVQFHKGLLSQAEVATFDKVFITTLFTFDFEMCIDTIRYYAVIVGINNVFVGGIAATIMPERFRAAIPAVQILEGQLTSSNVLGYNENVNIDILELDYDILLDIPYSYPAADGYFIYTSRGCPRKCSFCAVKTLEPNFLECQNIREQIARVDEKFGRKKQLLIMDNNILYSENLADTVEILENLGFGTTNNTIKKQSTMPCYLRSLWKRRETGKQYAHLFSRIKQDFLSLTFSRVNAADNEMLTPAITMINERNDDAFIAYLEENQAYIEDFFYRYNYHKVKRYVDFNQGLDARLFKQPQAQLLSRLAIKPCRIAFDDLNTKQEYFDALDVAVDSGILNFSNYLLYNYKDSPQDLWMRLFLNVDYCEKRNEKITLFSFPMKYAAIDHTDRSYIGEQWYKKYLKSMNVILNVTAGVVAKEKPFFLRAFGENEEAFLEILTMPDDFIRYRDYFESNHLVERWLQQYRDLTSAEKQELIVLLSGVSTEIEVPDVPHSATLNAILQFYTLKKNKIEKNKAYYDRLFGLGELRFS